MRALIGGGILFLVRYPNEKDLKDGYFQRVKAIDDLLSDYLRLYVHYEDSRSLFPKTIKIRERVYEIRLSGKTHKLMLLIFVLIFINRIYAHSIWSLQSIYHQRLFLLSKKKILDIHGAGPEEIELHGDTKGGTAFNKIEQFAIDHADIIIGVTNRMLSHMRLKYGLNAKKCGHSIILPILPQMKKADEKTKEVDSCSVIYCGGIQKWQQLDKMLEFVNRNKDKMSFAFLVPDPVEITSRYRQLFKNDFPGKVESVDSGKVCDWYKNYAYGLVLRDDIIVNNIACPTKLIEYLQHDVVPIVDSENIGDFKVLGYSYVSYKDELPSRGEWAKMVQQNRIVLKKIYETYEAGKLELMNNL